MERRGHQEQHAINTLQDTLSKRSTMEMIA